MAIKACSACSLVTGVPSEVYEYRVLYSYCSLAIVLSLNDTRAKPVSPFRSSIMASEANDPARGIIWPSRHRYCKVTSYPSTPCGSTSLLDERLMRTAATLLWPAPVEVPHHPRSLLPNRDTMAEKLAKYKIEIQQVRSVCFPPAWQAGSGMGDSFLPHLLPNDLPTFTWISFLACARTLWQAHSLSSLL